MKNFLVCDAIKSICKTHRNLRIKKETVTPKLTTMQPLCVSKRIIWEMIIWFVHVKHRLHLYPAACNDARMLSHCRVLCLLHQSRISQLCSWNHFTAFHKAALLFSITAFNNFFFCSTGQCSWFIVWYTISAWMPATRCANSRFPSSVFGACTMILIGTDFRPIQLTRFHICCEILCVLHQNQ